jgi:hypothetical protein
MRVTTARRIRVTVSCCDLCPVSRDSWADPDRMGSSVVLVVRVIACDRGRTAQPRLALGLVAPRANEDVAARNKTEGRIKRITEKSTYAPKLHVPRKQAENHAPPNFTPQTLRKGFGPNSAHIWCARCSYAPLELSQAVPAAPEVVSDTRVM